MQLFPNNVYNSLMGKRLIDQTRSRWNISLAEQVIGELYAIC